MLSKWKIDLNREVIGSKSVVSKEIIPNPLGFETNLNLEVDEASMTMSTEMQIAAKNRQVMAISYGPGKSLFTTAFMLWMSGSSIQIFSIMMTGMSLINPFKALLATNETFKNFEKEEGVDLKIPKLIFVSLQLLSLGVALYKCSTMGLLPLTSADWVYQLPIGNYIEHGGIPI